MRYPQLLHRDKLIELAALRICTLYPQNNFINEFAFNLSKYSEKSICRKIDFFFPVLPTHKKNRRILVSFGNMYFNFVIQ